MIVGLDEPGRHRLELILGDGQLVQWYQHHERRGRREFEQYDDRARLMGRMDA